MKKLLTLSYCLFAVICASAQKTDLRYTLNPGDRYESNTRMHTSVNQTVMEAVVDMEVVMDMDVLYVVRSVSGDVYDIEVSYSRVAQEMYSPYGDSFYSSDGSEEDPMNRMLKGMTGTSFMMKMDARGKVLEMSGLDRIAENVAAAISDDPTQRESIESQIRESLGEEGFAKSFQLSSAPYPEYPVEEGDEWTFEGTYSANGISMDMNLVYRYQGVEDNCWIIGVTGNLSTPPDSKMFSEGVEISFDLAGDVSFELWIDPATGWPEKVIVDMPMEGKMSTSIPEYGEMIIDVKAGVSAETERIGPAR